MKIIYRYMVLLICLVCISSYTGNASGQDKEVIDTGEIIEIAEAEHIIQVKNRNYVVTAVFVDDGTTSEPVPGFFTNLKVGSIVELHVKGKNNGFWQAKKVILLTGEKEEEVKKNLK